MCGSIHRKENSKNNNRNTSTSGEDMATVNVFSWGLGKAGRNMVKKMQRKEAD